jgi:hypothetical protein
MRLRSLRHRRRSLALDPKAVRVSQREILDDLQYPARERRGADAGAAEPPATPREKQSTRGTGSPILLTPPCAESSDTWAGDPAAIC